MITHGTLLYIKKNPYFFFFMSSLLTLWPFTLTCKILVLNKQDTLVLHICQRITLKLCYGMCLSWGDLGKCLVPLGDISISGLICDGLLVHTWLVCVSVQGADMSRQMLFLHSRNTICEQRLKHCCFSTLCIFIWLRCIIDIWILKLLALSSLCVYMWMCWCACMWVRDRLNACICMCVYICMKGIQGACSLYSWVSAEIELWAANSLLQHWDYVLF